MTEITVYNESTELAEATESVAFNPVTGFVNTFDLTSDEGKKKTLNAVNNSISLAKIDDGTVLKVADVITTPGVRKGRNGQPDVSCQNTHLITEDGTAYFSQSDGIARSINMIMSLFPDCGGKDGYLEMSVISEILPNGNTLKTLIVI